MAVKFDDRPFHLFTDDAETWIAQSIDQLPELAKAGNHDLSVFGDEKLEDLFTQIPDDEPFSYARDPYDEPTKFETKTAGEWARCEPPGLFASTEY